MIAARTGGLASFQGMGRDLVADEPRRQAGKRIEEDGTVAGAVFESYVTMELLRLAEVSTAEASLFHYRDKLGDRFKCGVVLYTGERTLPFGDRIWVVPLAALWS